MKKVSAVLREVYDVSWEDLNMLECGAHVFGEETHEFLSTSNCWYIEANPDDFQLLQAAKKNSLHYALSDKDGMLEFTVSSHPGNSSCEHGPDHLAELQTQYKAQFKRIEVEAITYKSLLAKLKLTFDVLVLDIEGHEVTVLTSWLAIDPSLLPRILVIECGYDWSDRLTVLTALGYRLDCYYFNNCYLSRDGVQSRPRARKRFNAQWPTFVWNGKTIYVNEKHERSPVSALLGKVSAFVRKAFQ
jgi:FkbM family methyltransferase